MTAVPLVRTSERNDFKRCPWLWYQSWVLGQTSRRVPTWSWFGTAIHRGLEVRYPPGNKRGKKADVIDAFVEACEQQHRLVYTAGGELNEEEVVDGIALGKAMLLGYIDEYGKDEEWEVIHSEQSFQIDVPRLDLADTDPLAIYCGTWDSLWRHRSNKEFWLVDHKTRSGFPSNWTFYDINDQAGSYLWVAPEVLRALGIFKKKDKIEGLIFNALRKHLPPDPSTIDEHGVKRNKPIKADYYEALKSHIDLNPNRLPAIPVLSQYANDLNLVVLGKESAVQPAPLFHREEVYRSQVERVKQGQRVQAEVTWMNAVRNGEMPLFKTPTEDCVRCQFFDVCQMDETSKQEADELASAVLMYRDPYASHVADMERTGGVEVNVKEIK